MMAHLGWCRRLTAYCRRCRQSTVYCQWRRRSMVYCRWCRRSTVDGLLSMVCLGRCRWSTVYTLLSTVNMDGRRSACAGAGGQSSTSACLGSAFRSHGSSQSGRAEISQGLRQSTLRMLLRLFFPFTTLITFQTICRGPSSSFILDLSSLLCIVFACLTYVLIISLLFVDHPGPSIRQSLMSQHLCKDSRLHP